MTSYGNVIARYGSTKSPSKIENDIKNLLGE
jgi:glutathione peroxidase-family protein